MLYGRLRYSAAVPVVCYLLLLMSCGSSGPTSIAPSAATLLPGQSFQFTVGTVSLSPPVLLVNGIVGGSSSTGTITPDGLYTAPKAASAQRVTVSIQGQSSSAAVTLISGVSGSVAATPHPLVASYSITAPAASSVQVQFGPDTGYGLTTSTTTTANGGPMTILVAGMRASSTYHMQAILTLANGSKVLDSDHTFKTGSIPTNRLPNVTGQGTGVGSPSPGVELFSTANSYGGDQFSAFATDLEGNVIWYYDLGLTNWALPIKPLANGHYLVLVVPNDATGAGYGNEIREVDLAGNIITSLPLSTVNAAVTSIFGAPLSSFHHDVAVLPNGHWILLVNYGETINNVSGVPPDTGMEGDALIDWDPQQRAVWTWSTFDHLPLSHAPYGFADWTHSNAIIYSPTDGNLILSMRNQNWIIKINYQNGAGDGSVQWTFGDGGSFTLPPDQAPREWNYGQHYPTVVSANSSGVFSLMFFNDGNNRLMDSNNDVCGTAGVGACYSSVPVFQLDESAQTASVLWEANLLPYYSLCCGDALILPNGDMEVDIADDLTVAPGTSAIEEFTYAEPPELVWKMQVPLQLAYRGFRIPSLYPDQTWSATALSGPRRTISPEEMKNAARKSATVNRLNKPLL